MKYPFANFQLQESDVDLQKLPGWDSGSQESHYKEQAHHKIVLIRYSAYQSQVSMKSDNLSYPPFRVIDFKTITFKLKIS